MKESCGNILLNDTRAISYPRDVLIMAQARKERKRAPAQNNKIKAE
jgi:hypothetical protein